MLRTSLHARDFNMHIKREVTVFQWKAGTDTSNRYIKQSVIRAALTVVDLRAECTELDHSAEAGLHSA